MEIRTATQNDKSLTLKIIDEFNDFLNLRKQQEGFTPSTLVRDKAGKIFDEMLALGRSKIFIAIENEEAIGFLEIHKVPRFRKAKYYGEIEGLFVRSDYQGKGIAKELMRLAYQWAQEQDLDCIRLYSGFDLTRAHAFYKKMGFDEAGISFKSYNFNSLN